GHPGSDGGVGLGRSPPGGGRSAGQLSRAGSQGAMSLGPQGAVGLILVIGGGLLGAPLVVVLGLCATGFDLARGVWRERGLVGLDVGDLFAGSAGIVEIEQHDRWIVRPRSVPVRGVMVRERWAGDERARLGLLEQPISYAGIRDYVPGDPVRRIHVRTSARL